MGREDCCHWGFGGTRRAEGVGRARYEPSYCLLEEARKSWDHTISNKVVYSLDPIEVTTNPLAHVAKDYVDGNVWIECHLSFEAQWHAHYVVILEFDKRLDALRDVGKVERKR